MRTTAEITLYPNDENFIPPIDAFIERLNSYADIKVQTFPTATIVVGEHDRVLQIIAEETKAHREAHGMGPFVIKLLPGYEAI